MSKKPKIHLHEASIFWGTILGFLLGAIVWMFRLPKRGEDTRQQIAETGREFFQRDPVNEHQEALSDTDTS